MAKYLDERGIVVEKTGPYNLLFLFSIGIDKTKAMSLLRGLTDFKRAYDLNLRVKNMLPDLYAEDPDFYRNMRIQELAAGIHRLICQHELPRLMQQAFDVLPEMKLTPHQMFQEQVRGNVETCELDQLVGKVAANMILPYPPGVPLVMPGEMITEESRAVLDFLLMLCSIGERYPGFETDIHGAKLTEDGRYLVKVLKARSRNALHARRFGKICRAFSLTSSPPPDTLPHQTEQERPPCWRYVRYTISRSLARTTPPVSILLRHSRIYPAERSLPRGARLWKADLALNGQYTIELFSFPSPPARVSRPEACGLRHLAFSVDDIDRPSPICRRPASPANRSASILIPNPVLPFQRSRWFTVRIIRELTA